MEQPNFKNGCFASRRLNLFALLAGVVQKALADYLSESSDYLRESGENQDEKVKAYLLSSNTLIVKSNKTGADMHFIIGLKNDSNKYESAIYLKLNSFSKEDNSWENRCSLICRLQKITWTTLHCY
jgi:hypothetical protein